MSRRARELLRRDVVGGRSERSRRRQSEISTDARSSTPPPGFLVSCFPYWSPPALRSLAFFAAKFGALVAVRAEVERPERPILRALKQSVAKAWGAGL